MANDNFNLSKADVAAIGGTFQESARIDRKRRERDEERREGRGFWGDLGTTLASGVVQQAVVEPITESVAGFINRPFADRDNIFLKSIEGTTRAQTFARSRARIDLERDESLEVEGYTLEQRATEAALPAIMKDLTRAFRKGEVPENLKGKISLSALQGKDGTLELIGRELAREQVTANDNAGITAYDSKIKAGKLLDLSKEGDASLRERYLQYNNLSQNWIEKGLNMLRGRSDDDLLDIAAKKIAGTDRYQRNTDVQKAIENWNTFRNPESMEELTSAKSVADAISNIDPGALVDTKIDSHVEIKVAPEGHKFEGQQIRTLGYLERKTNRLTGEVISNKFIATGEARSTTTAAETLGMYGDPSTAVTNLSRLGLSESSIINLLEQIRNVGDGKGGLYVLQSWKAQAGQEGAIERHQRVMQLINDAVQNKDNRRPDYSTALVTRQTKSLATLAADERRFLNALGKIDEGVEAYNQGQFPLDESYKDASPMRVIAAKLNLWRIQRGVYNRQAAGVIANVIELTTSGEGVGTPVPVGFMLDKNDNLVRNPDANLTIGQYGINFERFKAWERGTELTPKEEAAILESTTDGDKLQFKEINGAPSIFNPETKEYSPIAVVEPRIAEPAASDRVDVKDVLKLPVPPVKEGLEIERGMSGEELSAVKTAKALYRKEYIEYQKQLEEFENLLLEVNPRPENLGKTGRGITVGSRSSSEQWDRRNKNLRKTGIPKSLILKLDAIK